MGLASVSTVFAMPSYERGQSLVIRFGAVGPKK